MPGSIMGGGGVTQLFAGKQLPEELKTVLERLLDRFGPNLHFISYDGEYVNFQVWGMHDEVLFRMLERDRASLFGREFLNFQVLRPHGNSNDRGVFLRYLKPEIRHEYKSGFWYY